MGQVGQPKRDTPSPAHSSNLEFTTGDSKMYHFIYKTTNLINGKIYIGAHSTDNINDSYLGSGVLLHRAIKKYGRENFQREIIHFCENSEELYQLEREIVNEEFIVRDDVYNVTLGGGGGNPLLGQYVVENKLGIHAMTFEERSVCSKEIQRNRNPEERRRMCAMGGKIGSRVGMERKSGIFGLTAEQRTANGKKGSAIAKENGSSFYNREMQIEWGRRGGPKNKGFVWLTNGAIDLKYTTKMQQEMPVDDFLRANEGFRLGRMEKPYKPREKMQGKVSVTNGIVNLMLDGEENALEYIADNPGFRKGRTNFKKMKSPKRSNNKQFNKDPFGRK